MRKPLRVLTLLLACLMLAGLFTACSGNGGTATTAAGGTTAAAATTTKAATAAATTKATAATTTTAAAPSGPAVTAPGELPIVTEPVTLSLGLRQNVQITDYEDNYLTNYLEDTAGVNLEFVFFPSDNTEAQQKLELMVASNQELPDMLITISLSDLARSSYGTQGVILPMDDLLKEYAFFWKAGMEKWATPKEMENVMKLGLSLDGKLYAFPFYYSDPTDPQALGGWINKVWLENLGLDMPETTDDLVTVLTAFRDDDPNGNGLKDEIPLIGSTGWVSNPAQWLMNSFIYYSDYMLNADNGKVSLPYVQDDFREGLRFLNTLNNEGLLSPLSFTQTSAQHKAMMDLTDDQASIVGVFVAHPHLVFSPGSGKRLEYTGMSPMVGPKGIAYTPMTVPMSPYNSFITRDCENPEIAFRFFDFLCKEETSLSIRFGEQDNKEKGWWYADPNATPKYANLGYTAYYDTLNKLWGTENKIIWNQNNTLLMPPAFFGAMAKQQLDDERQAYRTDNWAESVVLRFGKNPPEVVSKLLFTEAETAEVAEMRSTIETYVKESMVRFITGDLNIEKDWDAYLNDLKSMGLERYLELVQTCYTRMNG